MKKATDADRNYEAYMGPVLILLLDWIEGRLGDSVEEEKRRWKSLRLWIAKVVFALYHGWKLAVTVCTLLVALVAFRMWSTLKSASVEVIMPEPQVVTIKSESAAVAPVVVEKTVREVEYVEVPVPSDPIVVEVERVIERYTEKVVFPPGYTFSSSTMESTTSREDVSLCENPRVCEFIEKVNQVNDLSFADQEMPTRDILMLGLSGYSPRYPGKIVGVVRWHGPLPHYYGTDTGIHTCANDALMETPLAFSEVYLFLNMEKPSVRILLKEYEDVVGPYDSWVPVQHSCWN